MADVDKLREALAYKAGVVQRVMQTPDGVELLRFLQSEFLSRIEAKEPHQIIFNAGRADVVAYLMSLQAFNPQGR